MTTATQQAGSPYARHVGAKIRAELAYQGLSQDALAELLGENQTWVSRRITGSVPVDVADLHRIAAVLRVPIHQLLPTHETAPASAANAAGARSERSAP